MGTVARGRLAAVLQGNSDLWQFGRKLTLARFSKRRPKRWASDCAKDGRQGREGCVRLLEKGLYSAGSGVYQNGERCIRLTTRLRYGTYVHNKSSAAGRRRKYPKTGTCKPVSKN